MFHERKNVSKVSLENLQISLAMYMYNVTQVNYIMKIRIYNTYFICNTVHVLSLYNAADGVHRTDHFIAKLP